MSAVEGWQTKSLGAVIRDIGDGGTPNTNKKEYFGGTIPWIVIQDIRKEISSSKTTLTPIGLDSCSAKLWPAGSIILSTGATIGEVGLAKVPLSTKQGIHGIVCGEELLSSFLYYKLQTLRDFLNANAQGSTIREVRATFLRTIPISFPTALPEQTKIAEILSTVDRAIEQTEALIAKQQRIKTGLMQDLLTRGIDGQGNLRSEQIHEFKDSPLGRIPVEWEAPTIDELAVHVGSGVTPRGGESVYTKEGVLFIRSQNVHFGGLLLADVSYISQKIHVTMKRSEVFENDVLLNITGASIGRCCSVPAIICTSNVNQHVCAIRLSKATQSDAGYLTAVIESSIGQNQILQFNAGGNREGLNYQQVRSFVIPWPKVEERQRLHTVIKKSTEALKVSGHYLEKLRSLKTALMQDLLTGKKRVTALLNDTEVIHG